MSDPIVDLARESVEGFVQTGVPIKRPTDLDDALVRERTGVFVSLHKGDDLRGCIGTIAAVQPCIADEIIANAVSAASRDPRFYPVTPEELDYLSYSVDVLGAPETIYDASELDPSRYGVIVTKGHRRGLLLPDLEGVDTVDEQISIARRKAGIGAFEEGVTLERFEVVRHSEGGQARKPLPS